MKLCLKLLVDNIHWFSGNIHSFITYFINIAVKVKVRKNWRAIPRFSSLNRQCQIWVKLYNQQSKTTIAKITCKSYLKF